MEILHPTSTVHQVWQEAREFIRLFHRENPEAGDPAARLDAVRTQLAETGTYRHTHDEVVHGARVAWRNSNRCIGRLYWNSLRVRDRRGLAGADEIAAECFEHLRDATNGGRVRPTITVFAPDAPDRPGPLIWSEQLIRYAGYGDEDSIPVGDPRNASLTRTLCRLGWTGGRGTAFDLLPLVVQGRDDKPRWFELPADAVLEVPIEHPEGDHWADWGLRWHAVPAISNMCLEIGGIHYPAAPFNGWYMGTEIGSRNLGDEDRYNLLPEVARRMRLDTSSDRSLWKDRAMVELNRAVLDSFDRAGVTIADHHTESRRFLSHIDREERKGRDVGADWSWIVPPMSGSATPVFHRTYEDRRQSPAYVQHAGARERALGRDLV
ncbi:nitric oxide synthase oxygenase [Streptomyces sp. NBC_00536]|uniref:nitric oxide synthase oxygenase n=1 Tax=Streptomyces sp. NBC_00536 TaxID=2975769 RepID=UPI002E815121|nr:nitric oxide synthase oxygenase [Streptomyces sp. NBC_00536]WUC77639.1 nitric oxide synthase oxygenase [Streptomyces sp. NBC_00536]